MRIESKILANLIHNEEFCRKALPFIVGDYFSDKLEKVVFEEIHKFFESYKKLPTQDIINIELANRRDITDKELSECTRLVTNLHPDRTNLDWILAKTEQFCKDRAVYNAILRSIKIIEGKDQHTTAEGIPKILQDALGVSFDQNVGHDYVNDAEARFDFYHRVEEKLSFDLEMMNKITGGGLNRKTLNVILAGPKAGKSLFMCHVAASVLMQQRNVLYITLELAEERVAERIDANLMDVTLAELKTLDKQSFDTKVQKIAKKTRGRLVIKEYPTTSAHVGHFRALLEQLSTKQDFRPDLIIIDYLNICSSARMKMGVANSYTYVKSIAEEIRGLAVEYNVPILSATQTNREGFNNSDVELTNTSESFGVPATVDLMFALIRSEELDQLNQVMIKQLASRYGDPTVYKRFVLGINRAKMQLYDVEDSAQDGIVDSGQDVEDTPVFDKSTFGRRQRREGGYDSFKF